MANLYIPYYLHSLFIDGTEILGVQTVNIGYNPDVTSIIQKGDPTNVKNFYKLPNIEVSFDKFLADDTPTIFPSIFNAYRTPVDTYNIDMKLVDGVGISLADCVITGLASSYQTTGFFKESITYNGRLIKTGSSTAQHERSGHVKRRQDFVKTGLPSHVTNKVLLEASISFGANYANIPTFGGFYAKKGRYISYPCDVTSEFTVLDLGFSIANNLIVIEGQDAAKDNIAYETINTQGCNLGDKNVLIGIERGGGTAGNSDYSTYKYRYKNYNSHFVIS